MTWKGIGGNVPKVRLEYKGLGGSIRYTAKSLQKGEYSLDFPSEEVERRVREYLATEMEFKIPQSPKIDDFSVERGKPTDNFTYFELALCTLWRYTGVWVIWGDG